MNGINLQEVQRHNSKSDAWIVFKQEVYNVTDYVDQHPGGLILLDHAGKDATDAITNQPAHRCVFTFILSKLKTFHVGTLTE